MKKEKVFIIKRLGLERKREGMYAFVHFDEPLSKENLKQWIEGTWYFISERIKSHKTMHEVTEILNDIEEFDRELLKYKAEIRKLIDKVQKDAQNRKSSHLLSFLRNRRIRKEAEHKIGVLFSLMRLIDFQIETNAEHTALLIEEKRKDDLRNCPDVVQFERKFQSATQAMTSGNYTLAYELFEECYNNHYYADKCAEALGLIAFNQFNDIEKTRVWFTRAARLGSQETFVYLYLGEIYQAHGYGIPEYIFFKGLGRGVSVLAPETIEKIKRLVMKNK